MALKMGVKTQKRVADYFTIAEDLILPIARHILTELIGETEAKN